MADKTSTGIKANVEGALCYLLWFISGIVFILIEKENRFVRFHAMQSIFTFGATFVLLVILNLIPVIGWLISPFVMVAGIILWVFLMVKAYRGEHYKLPVIGDMAQKSI